MFFRKETNLLVNFNNKKSHITKVLENMCTRTHCYIDNNDYKTPSLFIPHILLLIEKYVETCIYDRKLGVTNQLLIITVACFWITDKFHNDISLSLHNIKHISGGISRTMIAKEEIKILESVDFNVWRYMT
jgi:hypothetical protein